MASSTPDIPRSDREPVRRLVCRIERMRLPSMGWRVGKRRSTVSCGKGPEGRDEG
jgi:hypothetical protein